MILTTGERLLILRRRMKISQAEMGALLDVTPKTVQKIELDRGKVRPQTLERIDILEQRHEEQSSQSQESMNASTSV